MPAFQQVKHFVVPLFEDGEMEAALNRFLKSHSVLSVRKASSRVVAAPARGAVRMLRKSFGLSNEQKRSRRTARKGLPAGYPDRAFYTRGGTLETRLTK